MPEQFNAATPKGWKGARGYIARVAKAANDENGSALFRRLVQEEGKRLGVEPPQDVTKE